MTGYTSRIRTARSYSEVQAVVRDFIISSLDGNPMLWHSLYKKINDDLFRVEEEEENVGLIYGLMKDIMKDDSVFIRIRELEFVDPNSDRTTLVMAKDPFMVYKFESQTFELWGLQKDSEKMDRKLEEIVKKLNERVKYDFFLW